MHDLIHSDYWNLDITFLHKTGTVNIGGKSFFNLHLKTVETPTWKFVNLSLRPKSNTYSPLNSVTDFFVWCLVLGRLCSVGLFAANIRPLSKLLGLEPIPAVVEWEAGYIPDRSPVYHSLLLLKTDDWNGTVKSSCGCKTKTGTWVELQTISSYNRPIDDC